MENGDKFLLNSISEGNFLKDIYPLYKKTF